MTRRIAWTALTLAAVVIAFSIRAAMHGTGESHQQLYLVTMEYVDPGPMLPLPQVLELLENAVLPSLDMLTKYEDEEIVLAGGLPVAGRAAVAVMQAPSHEKLGEWLDALPFGGIVKTEVTPLTTFESRLESDAAFLEQMKAQMAEM